VIGEVPGRSVSGKDLAVMTEEERNTALFGSLIVMFQSAAMQHMGKIKNPATDKIERDLTQAQMMIDMLDMLSAKTKNNLTAEEARFLGDVLREVKLNYVDEQNKKAEMNKESS